MKIIIVRHAEAEGNIKKIFQGWLDCAITDKGHIQAKLVAKALEKEKIDLLFSSSSLRTVQTANYIARVKNLFINEDKNLREINGGDWEGKMWSELPSLWPEAVYTWNNCLHKHQMPNGESVTEFQNRIVTAFNKISKRHQDKNICIVTHGLAIKVLLCHIYEYEVERMEQIIWFDNTAITVIESNKGKYKVLNEGDIFHLGKEYSTLNKQEWWDEYIKKYNERKSEILNEKL